MPAGGRASGRSGGRALLVSRPSQPHAGTVTRRWCVLRASIRRFTGTPTGLPSGVPEPRLLPVMTKRALMARFDDWVTDAAIRRQDVDAFLADRTHIGERYLGRYIVWKSSGTTGEPGIYMQDDDALAVYDALIAVQLSTAELAGKCVAGCFQGGRAALIAATGDHFASIALLGARVPVGPGLAARGFSVMDATRSPGRRTQCIRAGLSCKLSDDADPARGGARRRPPARRTHDRVVRRRVSRARRTRRTSSGHSTVRCSMNTEHRSA